MYIKAVGIAVAIVMASGSAFAQSSTVRGAAVGGIVGGVAGSVIDPPPQKVVAYVQQAPVPKSASLLRRMWLLVSRSLRPLSLRRSPTNPNTPMRSSTMSA